MRSLTPSAAPTGRRPLPVAGESSAVVTGAGLPGRGVPVLGWWAARGVQVCLHRVPPRRTQAAARGPGQAHPRPEQAVRVHPRTNRHVTLQRGGETMPQPRQHTDTAAKQRAYRDRQAQARAAEQQAKGLPAAPPIASMPSRARWQALLAHARGALETVQLEQQAYWDERSETWQESERGAVMAEELEQLGVVLDELAALAATAGPPSPACCAHDDAERRYLDHTGHSVITG
jgi:hypothetical protein